MSAGEVACACCGAVETVDVAVDGGEWIPYYWDIATNSEVGPTCPACVASLGIEYESVTGEHIRYIEHKVVARV